MTYYIVSWDQWYRCGRTGDDVDYDHYKAQFATQAAAESFVDDLVSGVHRGSHDCRVHRNEVTLTEKKVEQISI